MSPPLRFCSQAIGIFFSKNTLPRRLPRRLARSFQASAWLLASAKRASMNRRQKSTSVGVVGAIGMHA
jgi:hypothetical protein